MSANRRIYRYRQKKEERKRKRRRQTKRHICRLIVMDSNTLGAPGRTNERLRSASGLKRRCSRSRRRSRPEPEQLRGELPSRVEHSKWPNNGRKSAPNLRWHVACGSVICLSYGRGGRKVGHRCLFFGASCGTPRVLSAHYEATCSAH